MHPRITEMIQLARRDLAALSRARTAAESIELWESFVDHANRVINRLDRPSAKIGRHSEFKAVLAAVWASPLASYMRAARNAGEHGVDILAIADPRERIAFTDGTILPTMTCHYTNEEGETAVLPSGELVSFESNTPFNVYRQPAALTLAPVADSRGNTIFPPIVTLQDEREMEHVAIARTYLDWVEQKAQLVLVSGTSECDALNERGRP